MNRKHPIHLDPGPGRKIPPIVAVTCCTQDRKRILTGDQTHQIIADAWLKYDHWLVGRYVIMPDHIHFFCSPGAEELSTLSVWMKVWKSAVSRQWPTPFQQPIWQRDHWDRELRLGESYQVAWEYNLQNPVRAGLIERAEDWPYQGVLNELIWN